MLKWLKATALGALAWVKRTVARGWNATIDPPPQHAKVYFWIVLATTIGGYFFWAPVVGGVKAFFGPVYEAVTVLQPVSVNRKHTPLPLVSPHDVVTTVPPAPVAAVAPVSEPPAPAPARVASEDLAPRKLLKKEPVKKKAARRKGAKLTSARDDMRLDR